MEAGLLWVFCYFQQSTNRGWEDTFEFGDKAVTCDLRDGIFNNGMQGMAKFPQLSDYTHVKMIKNEKASIISSSGLGHQARNKKSKKVIQLLSKGSCVKVKGIIINVMKLLQAIHITHHPRKIRWDVTAVGISFLKLSR